MAGSLTYRTYISDAGVSYSIKIDESNASATPNSGPAGELCPERSANHPAPPTGIKYRYVLCFAASNPLLKRKFIVGNPAIIPALIAPGATLTSEAYPGASDTTGAALTWVITAYRGEKSRSIPPFTAPDTGLLDGDAAQ